MHSQKNAGTQEPGSLFFSGLNPEKYLKYYIGFWKILEKFSKNTEKYQWDLKKGPHLILVVKIRKNTQNAEKYSGNPEQYYWEK